MALNTDPAKLNNLPDVNADAPAIFDTADNDIAELSK
eukprot:CAMPEP_0172478962 /NCGR_PEP_ID=MMETSP1066-20121228/3202_1 /TAXON_ID=671091 /ORGANISM="Coscinodiscus wailesii, Strain CCMP2513" /LENGTH=36 /DNA_ID= /DNA_START= /DNA_END= /DNA_ORIENTATION=